jgi:hypothetical protein
MGARFGLGGGETLTVNPTKDPKVPGGWYQTTTKGKGKKSTAVYDADGNMPRGRGDNDRYR